jgi:hypothetical protein
MTRNFEHSDLAKFLPPVELAAHLDALAARAADRVPLREPGEAEPEPDPFLILQCWCCGRLGRRKELPFWHVRPADEKNKETYCPACFLRWGWPEMAGQGGC